MAETTFQIIGDVAVAITVTEVAGDLVFTVEVLDETGQIGDLRGLFFDLSDDSLTGLTIIGDDVTAQGTDTKDLGNGNNMNGGGRGKYDVGVGFGTPGIGNDDIQTTTFTLSADQDLSIDDLAENFGVRLTSVGEEGGPREGSLKLTEICEKVCEEEEVCTELKIDFEQFEAGDLVDEIILGDLVVSVQADEDDSSDATTDNDAMIFDSENPTGGDPDLGTADQGKVLIITENDNAANPDDSKDGGVVVFEFSEAVDLTSILLIDTNGGSITTDQGGNVSIPNLEDNQTDVLLLASETGFEDVMTLTVNMRGSGAIDDLCFEVCKIVETCSCEYELL